MGVASYIVSNFYTELKQTDCSRSGGNRYKNVTLVISRYTEGGGGGGVAKVE